jgi:acryloyl-coenzyme A reductase
MTRKLMIKSFSTMRQVILREPGPRTALTPELVVFSPNQDLQDRQALVRVAACAVAYRDIIDRTGGFPFMNKPTVLGHEVAGVVERAAADSKLKAGDRVVSLHWGQYDGEAWPSPFLHKKAMKSFLGLTCNGGYAEYMTAHDSAFVKVPSPKQWTAIDAAPVMSTFGTVWQGAVVRGGLTKNERVLVTGAAGGVGSSAISIASRLGAYVIGATGSVTKKAAFMKSLGASEVIDSSSGFSKSIGGVDMVIECVGAPTFSESLRALKPGGRLILIGNVTNANAQLPLGLCIVKSLSVIGTDSIEANELPKLFDWLDNEKLRPTVDKVMSLEEAVEAHRLVEERSVTGRIVLDVNSAIW